MKAGYQGKDSMRESAEKLLGCKKGGKVKKMKSKKMFFGGSPNPMGGDFKPSADLGGAMKKGGKAKKMAMGGVGKIRHNVATKDGTPIRHKKKMKALF